jgi:hypothetical protein
MGFDVAGFLKGLFADGGGPGPVKRSADRPAKQVEAAATPAIDAPSKSGRACLCGSAETADVPIHDGKSVRRDCVKYGRFVDFPVWYGRSRN